MIIFMRHAERGDNEIPKQLSQVQYDPPIIEASKDTIKSTAAEISELFQVNKIKKFQVLCSKFLRCLMTMKGIEKHLKEDGFEGPSQYILDDQVCEYLRESWFPEYPMPNLIYKTNYLAKYVQNLKYQEKFKSDMHYPQSYPKFHNRITELKKSLKTPQQGTCLIVMTHGFVVREISFRMSQISNFQNQIKYCGYVAFINKNKDQIILRSKL